MKFPSLLHGAALFLLLLSAPVQAAIDVYVKIDGVTGETSLGSETGLIHVRDCSFSIDQPVSITPTAGAGAGRSSLSPLIFTKDLDRTSPVLFLDCAIGKPIPHAKFFFVKAGQDSQIIFTIDLSTVMISNYTAAAAEEVSESVSLRYGAVRLTYTPSADSGSQAPVSVTWDNIKNKSVGP